MTESSDKLALTLAKKFKGCKNPSSYKELTIATVQKLEPLELAVSNSQIILSEELGNLHIPEWFDFRCKIDETGVLSADVSSDLDDAVSIEETHSYTGSPCQMPNAILSLASAISGVRDELLKLKCVLAVGDKVVVSPLRADSEYVLIDKLKTGVE